MLLLLMLVQLMKSIMRFTRIDNFVEKKYFLKTRIKCFFKSYFFSFNFFENGRRFKIALWVFTFGQCLILSRKINSKNHEKNL